MPYEPLSGFLSVLSHDKDIPDLVPRPKIDEALAYYYFSLATIHDKMRDEGYIPIHNNSEAKQLAKSVWATIEKLCFDRQFIIKTALDYVKSDLILEKRKVCSIFCVFTKIPKWVYYFVVFLAALLTCVYLLWWLLTTIF